MPVRIKYSIPGYDHIEHDRCDPPCGGRYGRHGDEWYYAIRADDGLSALSLMVFTRIQPGSCHKDPPEGVSGVDLTYHCSSFGHVDEETGQVCRTAKIARGAAHADGAPVPVCAATGEPLCSTLWSTSLGASALFEEHGDLTRFDPQPEALWIDLEARFQKLDAKYRTDFLTADQIALIDGDHARRDAWIKERPAAWLAEQGGDYSTDIQVGQGVAVSDVHRWLVSALEGKGR